MDHNSIWRQTSQFACRASLAGNCETDVAVIGGGMAGILTAFLLHRDGKQVIVLEANRIGCGQTQNTTAKITSQHGLVYDSLIKQFGNRKARQYAFAQEDAIRYYADLIQSEGIVCNFERVNAYLYSSGQEYAIKREANAAAQLGIHASYLSQLDLPFATAGAVCFENQAQFNPLRFLEAISRELTVFENTRVMKVKNGCVITDRGTVRANSIVYATHYPFPIFPGFYFARQHQERSYVMALSGVSHDKVPEGIYYGTSKTDLSLRWYEDLLLIGGGGHRCGEKSGACGYAQLHRQVKEVFPEGRVITSWAAQDCMPHDGLPLVGRFSQLSANQYVITGLKKWGMTGSMVAARIISGIICGNPPAFTELFSPQRLHIKAGCRNFMEDMGYSVRGISQGLILRRSPRCSHMGCLLEWNQEEKTWDCPCHGSRFTEDGAVADSPANADLPRSYGNRFGD